MGLQSSGAPQCPILGSQSSSAPQYHCRTLYVEGSYQGGSYYEGSCFEGLYSSRAARRTRGKLWRAKASTPRSALAARAWQVRSQLRLLPLLRSYRGALFGEDAYDEGRHSTTPIHEESWRERASRLQL